MDFIRGRSRMAQALTAKTVKGFIALAVLTGVAGVAHKAWAQAVLQQQGTLAPMEDTYSFDGEAGQAMTIDLESEDFDTVLLLRGPDGEILTSNDDFGREFNSRIVIELPETGTYSAVATSFSNQGGSYQIEVRPASDYEQVFSRAFDLIVSEDFGEAAEAFTAAIALDDTDPNAYLGRAEAMVNEAYIFSEVEISGPQDLPEDVIEAVIADYFRAADLFEQQGETDIAASLREQTQFFTDEPPASTEPTPAESIDPTPDDLDLVDPDANAPIEAIPVEPDGGIGDGATPLPEPAE
ncbi:MAG: PPC domain-containing protein [Phormidesmis sp.]